MLKSSPETNIDANWLKTELLDSLEILFVCGFRVRAITYDNHPLNCSLVSRNCLNMSAWIWMNYIWYTSPKKSSFATTLSIKNVRDNPLNVDGLYSFRWISWIYRSNRCSWRGHCIENISLCLRKRCNLHANLRKEPELTTKVFTPW